MAKTKIYAKQFVFFLLVFILAVLISPVGNPLVLSSLGLLWILGAFYSAGLMEMEDRTAFNYNTQWDKVFAYLALEVILNIFISIAILFVIGAIF